jgi:SOS-response transcriptional repressor LexA/transcriptional regulator with XRE-family HTH domain
LRGKSKFSNKLGITPSNYNYYEKDRIPPIEILWKICEITGCQLEWLVSGQSSGPAESKNKPLDPLAQRIGLYLQDNPSSVRAMEAFFELLVHKNNFEVEKSHADPEQGGGTSQRYWLPVLGRTAAGIINYWPLGANGLPQVTQLGDLIQKHQVNILRKQPSRYVSSDSAMVGIPQLDAEQVSVIQLAEMTEQGVCEFVQCQRVVQRYPDAFALRIDGDSMSPHMEDGDLVILSPSVAHTEEAAGVVKLKNQIGVTCKIIRSQEDQLHLVPVNEKYDHQIVRQDQVEWTLAVLWRIRY